MPVTDGSSEVVEEMDQREHQSKNDGRTEVHKEASALQWIVDIG